ncbi:MAG: hypothetical protein KGY99_01405 [Phycisphaerae bacterium]|nr:hypothetical protein [Phycisphaerae bacterium]
MRRRTTTPVLACLTAVLMTVLTLVGPAGGRDDASGAYRQLDEVRLAAALGRMGMAELLKTLRDERAGVGDRTGRLVAEAQLQLIQADRATERDQHVAAVQRAVDTLRTAAENVPEDDASAAAWVKHLRVRFMLAETLALRQARTYAKAVLYLEAGPDDHRHFERITAEAMSVLRQMNDRAERLLDDWRRAPGSEGLENLMVKVPYVKRFRREIVFDAAWIRFYRGLALPSAETVAAAQDAVKAAETAQDAAGEPLREALEILHVPVEAPEGRAVGAFQQTCDALRALIDKSRAGELGEDASWQFRAAGNGLQNVLRLRGVRLREASEDVQQFVDDPQQGLKYWSLLLQGTAQRELDEHDKAQRTLGQIRSAVQAPGGLGTVGPEVAVDAMFQLARNEIERDTPDLERADEAIDLFVKVAGSAAGGNVSRRQGLEIRGALLRVKLYETLAARAEEPEVVRRHQRQAAWAMFAFANEQQRLAELESPTDEQSRRLAWLREHGEDLQSWLFVALVEGIQERPAGEGADPLYVQARRLAQVYDALPDAKTDEGRREVLASLRDMLEQEPPADAEYASDRERRLAQRIYVAARWQAGLVLHQLLQGERQTLLQEVTELRRKLAGGDLPASEARAAEQRLDALYERLTAPARLWYELAQRYTDHPLAFKAARNAAITLNRLINAGGDQGDDLPIDGALASMCRDALEFLTGQWPQRADMRQWRGMLAWLLDQLTEGDEMTVARLRHMLRAIPIFEKTPPDEPTYMQDWYAAIDKRQDLWRKQQQWVDVVAQVEDSDERTELRERLTEYTDAEAEAELIRMLGAFAAETLRRMDDANEAMREQLVNWGSSAAYARAAMLYDRAERESNPEDIDAALAQLSKVNENWPGTKEADKAELLEMQIRFEQVDEEDMEELLGRLEKLLQDRSASEVGRLIAALYSLRDRMEAQVNRLRRQNMSPRVRRELARYGRRYALFSRVIYEYQKETNGTAVDKPVTYEALTTYADALLAAGRTDASKLETAMAMWQHAREVDETKRERAKQEVEEQVSQWLATLEAARGDLLALRDLAGDCVAAFKDNPNVQPLRGEPRRLVKLHEEGDEPDVLAARIERACKQYRKHATQAVAADAVVLYGLARTYAQQGDYAEALELFRRVVRGLAPDQPRPPKAPELGSFWDVQLRYCQTWLEAKANDPEQMSQLATYLRQLEVTDADGFRIVYDAAMRRRGG